MQRLTGICALGLAALLANLNQADAAVTLTKGKDTVEIKINDRPFSTYNFKADLPKPFMFPVCGSDGTVLTRDIIYDRSKGDHPHHKGIWVAVDEIGGVQHWAEKGKIANREIELLTERGNPAQMRVVNDWLDEEGKPVVTETTLISIHENGLFAYDIRFTGVRPGPIEFGDTKEGLLGFRMVDSMQETPKKSKAPGGVVVNATGVTGTADTWGRPTDWIDYSGQVGGKTFGVALFDHPLNFRRSRYHVRNYGLFSISPFGEAAYTGKKRPAEPFYLLPGDEMRLRYGLFIHDGDTKAADVGGVYLGYLRSGL
jgi:hypothetical protein